MRHANLCEEKLRLLREFQEATVSLSSRVSDMANMTGIPEDAFVRLSHAATAAHEKCLEARNRFCNHLAGHRC
jgi:hypothetical protein